MQKVRFIKTFKNQLNYLRFCTNAAAKNTVSYKDTINIPKTEFPQRLKPTTQIEVERKINEVNNFILMQLFEILKKEMFYLFRIVSNICINGKESI